MICFNSNYLSVTYIVRKMDVKTKYWRLIRLSITLGRIAIETYLLDTDLLQRLFLNR